MLRSVLACRQASRPLLSGKWWPRRFSAKSFEMPEPARGPPLPPLESTTTVSKNARTMLHHIHNVQQKFPEAVVLTQVGSFMELYFEQASTYGPLLNLKVAKKQTRSPIDGNMPVFMAGFPLLQKERYEKILVKELGKTVVSLMQNSRYVIGGGTEEEKRPISRILTPGTLLEEGFVDEKTNNYLASVIITSNSTANLMWIDVGTGKVQYQVVTREELGNTLARIAPAEVLYDKRSTNREFVAEIVAQYAPQAVTTPFKYPPIEMWNTRANHAQRFRFDKLDTETRRSLVGLLSYIELCMPGLPIEIQEPEPFANNKIMHLDSRTRAALEISATSSGSTKGSLLSTIRRTRTPSGARLFQEWLAAPLQSPQEISERQDKVAFFLNQSRVTIASLQLLLSEMPDGPRTLQKLSFHRLNPMDLIVFARSVFTVNIIAEQMLAIRGLPQEWRQSFESLVAEPLITARSILNAINLDAFQEKGDETAALDTETTETANEPLLDAAAVVHPTKPKKRRSPRTAPATSTNYSFEPATHRGYKPVLYPQTSPRLKEIYSRQAEFRDRESAIRDRLQQTYGPSAELRWSPSHQFYVYIVLNGKNEPSSRLLLTKNKKTAYLSDSDWSALGGERLELSNELKIEEETILNDLRLSVLTDHLSTMRRLYGLLDEVDVLMSFATFAMERRLTRPKVVEDSKVFEIVEGRHITVETGLALGGFANTGFVANDCKLSAPQKICMITGPNMGGKSTFIRQSAIIALLAHVGAYVPAKSATIGVIDRIFCRLGAGDDLYSGRSTFMVEMLEISTILNQASSHSLAIIDEVGRGTSGSDGLAIAFASIKHLVQRTQCRALFATHYGMEIWDALCADSCTGDGNNSVAKVTEGISLLQASLKINADGAPSFDYKLQPGISTSSCGLLIAEMAGFPKLALDDAKALLAT